MVRPAGTVTFLFTDIEGSTRRWEADPAAMRLALMAHDDVLGRAVAAHGGWLFKHTGDGVCAAFSSARAAIDAAVQAQQGLALPVRMGVATGDAECRGDDYFGPTLNRAARVMAAGHGGQILVAASTAALVSGVDLVDLGEHRLRDLSGAEHLYQVRAEGLASEFARLRTVDSAPGNLPVQVTSFVGRDSQVKELAELVRAHRLVTLTGVGGVGKTRLAVHVAAALVSEHPDGVWLVELAPVSEPAALPDAVASMLAITAHAGAAVVDSIANALAGRRLLVVLDNCEHVLDAAAELVDTIMARTTTVRVIATSREGLGARAERLWPVPPLDVSDGTSSPAVALFNARARAVNPDFEPGEGAGGEAVTEICRRLDGIALAIELAAARMVSMNPAEVLSRLADRFRLLSGSRRASARHQTLRHAVAWSFDLLTDDERAVLCRCSVFADGFDHASAAHLCDRFDDYEVLDLLDSLVRKSLVTAGQARGRTRYGMLETIRQFADEELAARGTGPELRDRHARYFADQAVAHWHLWDGPRQPFALEWVDVEFANLRAGFRWAIDRHDLVAAAAIAAHTSLQAWPLQRFESVGWAEEVLGAARAGELAELPRLHTAAALCMYTGRAEDAVRHAETAVALATDPRYDGFDPTWSRLFEGGGHLYAGRLDRWLEISAALAAESGFAHVGGLCGMLHALPSMQRGDEARALADQAVAAARAHGNPYAIAWALFASGRAFAQTDPGRALTTMRQALDYAREHGLSYWEARIARDAAGLEAAHGDPDQALALFDTAIDSLHRAGDDGTLATAIAYLAIFFGHAGHPEVAAILYGATTGSTSTRSVLDLPGLVEWLRATLGSDEFDERVGRGAAMDAATATQYARRQIERAGDRLRPIRQRRPAPAPIAAPPGQRPMPPAAVDVTRGDQ